MACVLRVCATRVCVRATRVPDVKKGSRFVTSSWRRYRTMTKRTRRVTLMSWKFAIWFRSHDRFDLESEWEAKLAPNEWFGARRGVGSE